MKETLNYKKVSVVLAVVVVLLTVPHFCNDSSRLQGQYDILKKDLEEQKEIVNKTENIRIKERDSLYSVIALREDSNSKLVTINNNLRQRIKDLNSKPISVPKDLNGLVAYFNQRYKTIENKPVEDKVGLVVDVAQDVAIELEEGDRAIETVSLQESVIKNQDSIISNLSSDKVDLSSIVFSAEKEIKERKELQKMSDENIKVLEKQVKRQKRKNVWNKFLIIGGSVGGFLLGNQLNK